jgi:hypothetical protein
MIGDELADLAGVGSNREMACAIDGAEQPIGCADTNKFVGPLHGLGELPRKTSTGMSMVASSAASSGKPKALAQSRIFTAVVSIA